MLRNYWKRTVSLVLIFLLLLPCLMYAEGDKGVGNGGVLRDVFPEILPPAVKEGAQKPALAIMLGEVDFGDVGPGDVVNGLLTFKNIGAGLLPWSISGPEGWGPLENQELTGVLASETDYLRMSVRLLKNGLPDNADKTKDKSHNVQLTVEAGGKVILFCKDLPAGIYSEPLLITSQGVTTTVFLNFKVVDGKLKSQLSVEPPRIDFGVLSSGKQAAKHIKITNRGKETVKWRLIIPKPGDEKATTLTKRYVSFLNDDSKSGAAYLPAAHLREVLEISGNWLEHEGYPSANGVINFMRYHFSGTGISVHLRHGPDMGKLALYADDKLVHVYNGAAPEKGREELPVVEGLPEGQHVLTLENVEGAVIIEGISVYGKELMKGNPFRITFIPDSGTTTRETDYVNIRIDTQQMNPGLFGEPVILASNIGDMVLETYFEIKPDQIAKFLDVFRYVRNQNYLYTTNPQADLSKFQNRGYRKEGIAFRLFAPGTPGTTEFYRWYNSATDDHYYSYDLRGAEKALKGYVFEGSIGNIGTSRLNNTRELYRWHNPKTRSHFYTTDQKGEGLAGKGYNFDGIAGYVR
ncbi:MAG TPA: hypothetical protein VJZ49_12465 [Syntrophales bacterium]|nr:hypothetical protein [Syntrophales bacterium]